MLFPADASLWKGHQNRRVFLQPQGALSYSCLLALEIGVVTSQSDVLLCELGPSPIFKT